MEKENQRSQKLHMKQGNEYLLPDPVRMEEIRKKIFLFYDNRAYTERLIKLSFSITILAILLSSVGCFYNFFNTKSRKPER